MVSVQYLFPILPEALILYAVLYQLLFCCPAWFDIMCTVFFFFVILFILSLISDWNSSHGGCQFFSGYFGNGWDDGGTEVIKKKGRQINFFLSLSTVVL